MIRGDFGKRSVLHGLTTLNTAVRRLHLTSITSGRGALRKIRQNTAEEKHLDSGIDYLTENKSNVNFFGIESEEGVITVNPKINSLQQNLIKEKLKEKFYRASFGIIRYDCDNKLKFHGEYGKKDFIFPHSSNDYSEVSKSLDREPPKVTSCSNSPCDNVKGNKLNSYVRMSDNMQTYNNIDVLNKESSDPYSVMNDDDTQTYNIDVLNKESSDPYSVMSNDDTSYIDQCYFNNTMKEERKHSVQIISDQSLLPDELNYIDENYFGDEAAPESEKFNEKQNFIHDTSLVKDVHIEVNNKKNFKNLKSHDEKLNSVEINTEVLLKSNEEKDVFEDMFHNQANTLDISNRKFINVLNSAIDRNIKQFDNKCNGVNAKPDVNFVDINQNLLHKQNIHFENGVEPKKLHAPSSKNNVTGNYFPKTIEPYARIKGLKHSNADESVDETDMTRAIDFVENLQKGRKIPERVKKENGVLGIKVDSKGFRILKNQVEDLSYFTREEIINLLKQNILYSDDDILILNKPYSLVMHESQTTKSLCLSAFLDELANEISQQGAGSKLHTVHRLDKETTGCLLLARTEAMAQNLKSLFLQRKIIKKYWILTTRVPDPSEGVIDMPISEGSIENKKRMVLHPDIPKDIAYHNHSKRGKQAVTSYKVLSESGNAALVEATPITGIKHQIRVHFGFGLGCPILGDHKYSHLDKLAPQKLPSDILQRLHVRQSKVRYIPLHIHAKSVMIPGYFEGRELYVKAPLPNHIKENLRMLKFKK